MKEHTHVARDSAASRTAGPRPLAVAPAPHLSVQRRLVREALGAASGAPERVAPAAVPLAGNASNCSNKVHDAAELAARGVSRGGTDVPYRAEMEHAFGRDFSAVRACGGPPAVVACKALGASAYALGNHVAFATANPTRALVAHELAHVVQQGFAPVRGALGPVAAANAPVGSRATLGRPGDAFERAADQVADAFGRGDVTAVRSLAAARDAVSSLAPMIQGDFWDALSRGAEMHWGLDDDGAFLARDLMMHRVAGFGLTYGAYDPYTSQFVIDRPEIQRATVPVFQQQALLVAAGTRTEGSFSIDVTDVRLNELESMRLTLYGCHRIEVTGDYEVETSGSDRIVRFSDVWFVWVDRADLHPGTVTELDDGSDVDDQEFTSAGWDYDIRIPFNMPSVSTWTASAGVAHHTSGWSPVTGAPEAGFRG